MRLLHAWKSGMLMVLAMMSFAAVSQVSPLPSLLKMEGIDNSYAITYHDDHGKTLTKDAFAAEVAHGHSFNLDHDPAAHTATLTMQAPDKQMKLSPQALAALKSGAPGPHSLKPGQALPAFRLTSTDGRVFDNATLRGHTTLINFFFAQCAGCIEETPALSAYAKAHPQQQVLAVTFDDAKTASAYIAAHRFSWPVLADGMGFIQSMGVNAYPAMALVGPDGRLLKMTLSSNISGGVLTADALDRWVGKAPAAAH